MEKQMRADTHGPMSMPMDAFVWSGLVWSSLWLYWPHGRHALFGRAGYNCAPSVASWFCGTQTHTHTHRHTLPLA